MGAIPGDLETGRGPPMTIPLRHFLVALAFLLLGGVVGVGRAAGLLPARASLVHVHLLLVGWVCLTIMGAMTQFVPVWSGTRLHSRRLAAAQLWLVAVGLVGFAAGLLADRPVLVPAFGAAMALGLWLFAYNVGRTLGSLDAYDVTERHFALALGFFALLAALGALLAVDLVYPLFVHLPVARVDVVGAHATLAVFGAVLTTVLGALYQLGTMFTQTELHGVDRPLRRVEEVGYPVGVLALSAGRLLDVEPLGVAGAALVLGGLFGFSVVLARRLYETRVPRTPMLSRYAVLAPAMAAWAALTAPVWLRDPLSPAALLGPPGAVHLLTVGVVGFVVLGTLYHVVPFIVWVHRYSDLLGREDVPMVDDLYDDRIAAADFWCFLVGGGALVAADWVALSGPLAGVGGGLVLVGALLVLRNLLGVVHTHGPHSVTAILAPSAADSAPASPGDASADADSRWR